MVQIINRNPGILAGLGSGFGQGLGNSLEKLANFKINQLQERHNLDQTAKGLQNLPGLNLNEQQSQELAYLAQNNPTLFNSFINQHVKQKQLASERQAVERLHGKDIAALSPADRREYIKSSLRPTTLWEGLSSVFTGVPSQSNAQANIPQAYETPSGEQQLTTQQAYNMERERVKQEPYLKSSFGNLLGQLATKGAEGLGEGVTNVAALPFNLANLVSGGKIAVPEAVQSLQKLPKQVVEQLTGGQFKPQTETEKTIGNTVSDIASILSPSAFLGAVGKGAKLLGKSTPWVNAVSKFLDVTPKAAAKIAAGGNVAQWLTKQAGASEGVQQAAKIGTMLAIPIVGTKFAAGKVSELGNTIRQAIPEELNESSSTLFNEMGDLYNRVSKAPSSEIKDVLIENIEALNTNKFPVGKLWDFKQILEQSIKDPDIAKSVRSIYPDISKTINNTILKASNKVPELRPLISDYNELSNGLNQTSSIQNFVNKYVLMRNFDPVTRALYASASAARFGTRTAAVLPAVGASMTLGEAEKALKLAFKSPAFRRLYGDITKAALLGEVNIVKSDMNKLDKIIKKEK